MGFFYETYEIRQKRVDTQNFNVTFSLRLALVDGGPYGIEIIVFSSCMEN